MGSAITLDALHKRVSRGHVENGNVPEVVNCEGESVSSLSNEAASNAPETVTGNKPGRPRGSTKEKKQEESATYIVCVNEIVDAYFTELQLRKEVGGARVARGFLKNLIEEKKKEHGVSRRICEDTIRRRVLRGSHHPTHRGPKSPISDYEPTVVAMCVQMGHIRQPLNCSEGLMLMQDLIEGTTGQEALVKFQQKHKVATATFKHGTLTPNWWRAFLRRHDAEIRTKRGEKFASSRADWTKKSNICQMFDVIYDDLVYAKVAVVR